MGITEAEITPFSQKSVIWRLEHTYQPKSVIPPNKEVNKCDFWVLGFFSDLFLGFTEGCLLGCLTSVSSYLVHDLL